MLRSLLSLISAAVVAVATIGTAVAQAPTQMAALDTATIAAMKGPWTGKATDRNNFSTSIELVIEDIKQNGQLVGSMSFPSQTYKFTFGASVNKDAKMGVGTFDGKVVQITTPLGTSYTMSFAGRNLSGTFSGAKSSGEVSLGKR